MKYGSRKFILAVLSLFVSTGLLIDKDISADVWKTVVLGTVAVYISGNVAQKATAKKDAVAA